VGRVVPRPAESAGTILINAETAWPG